ncbi:MAG: hypothetical protein ACXADC_16820 [Candidatus Thorarchaeota archaeon]|jgi:hypothetical protein
MDSNWKRIGGWSGILLSVQLVIITSIIMLFLYPGGYDFWRVRISWIGFSEVYGIPTPLNWFLYATTTTLGAALSIVFWFSWRTVFTETTLSKALCWIGAIFGFVAALLWAVSAIFAGDLYGDIHNLAADYFVLFEIPAMVIYSIAILLKKDYGNFYALIGIVPAFIAIVHLSNIVWGLSAVALQKLAYYMIPFYASLQGFGLLRYSRKFAEVQATAGHQLEE